MTLAVAPDDFRNESELGPTDFLIRGIAGMDPKGGAIAVAEAIGVGKRIRFMVSHQQAVVTPNRLVYNAQDPLLCAPKLMNWCKMHRSPCTVHLGID